MNPRLPYFNPVGSGSAPCPCCGGQGFRYHSPSVWMGLMPAPVTAVRCHNCHGTGMIPIQSAPMELRPICVHRPEDSPVA